MMSADVGAQRAQAASLKVGKMDIGGVVTSSKGPEAGVWVIAQTKDTPTPFARIVVTDDQGQYLVPDLPRRQLLGVGSAGMVFSTQSRQAANLGRKGRYQTEVAPDAKSAALVYPAAWWAALMKLPDDWSSSNAAQNVPSTIKECYDCHQVGNKITRELGNTSSTTGATSTLDAWDRRTKVGPVGVRMAGAFQEFGKERNVFADWSDRIAHGEVPQTAPDRPPRSTLNLVITEWDWGLPNAGRADAATSDTSESSA